MLTKIQVDRRPAALALAFVLLAVLGGCERSGQSPETQTPEIDPDAPNVLLITLDTTRADRLGCYGYADAHTPALDALAASGVRFARAYCHVPLTLPSHISLFTGTFPPTHGISMNAGGILSREVPTITEAFQERGYRTGAFVGAWVVNGAFGLERGFEYYDDAEVTADDLMDITGQQRPADQVCDSALAWLEAEPGRPFFVWVHFFDPHWPYKAPTSYTQKCPDPYDAEIAFVDHQVSRLMAWLTATNLRDKTLVVAAGDHGEAFGEHGELEHGMFLYDPTTLVPLIFSFPGTLPAGTVVAKGGRLVDVFPTIVGLLGWPSPEGVDGVSMAAACRTGQGEFEPVYVEAKHSLFGFGWAALYSLITERYKFIDAPTPELYDLDADPAESVNLAERQPETAKELKAELSRLMGEMKRRAPQPLNVDAETLERLSALGYVDVPSFSEKDVTNGPLRDPKDVAEVYRATIEARRLSRAGRHAEAARLLEPLMDVSPESDTVWYTLGEAYLRMGDYVKAEGALAKSLRLDSDHPIRLCYLGDSLFHQRKYPEAIECYHKAIEAAPDFGEAYARMGAALLKTGQFIQAREYFVRHVEVEPTSFNALTNLASALHRAGEHEEALRRLHQALEYAPKYAPAHRLLWKVLVSLRRRPEAIDALRTAHKLMPEDREQAHILAIMLCTGRLSTPETVAEALQVLQSCCPPDEAGPKHFDTLATALAASGDFPRAVEAAQRALELARLQGNAVAVRQIAIRLEAYRQGRMPGPNPPR